MTRNSNFDAFVRRARDLAKQHNLVWDVPIGLDGEVASSEAWDFCQLVGVPRSPKARLTNLGPDRLALEKLGASTLSKRHRLQPDWIDLIKATALDWVLIQRKLPGTVHDRRVRPLRVIATCAGNTPPWLLTPVEARKAIEVAAAVAPSIRETTETCLGHVLDRNHLLTGGPVLQIALAGEARLSWPKGSSAPTIRRNLSDRKEAEKLPNERAFNELSRIVFTEKPKSFSDAIYFQKTKVHICTGFRVHENCLIPLDWRREKTHLMRDGRDASQVGGISASVGLRHFPGKQRGKNEDSSLLVERVQWLPPKVLPIVEEALDTLCRLTEPLRKTYRAQVQSGRLFPEFQEQELVPAWEFYPRLSGDLRLVDDQLPSELEHEYLETFDPEILERIGRSQCPTARLRPDVVNYFYQFGTRAAGRGGRLFPARQRDGSEWTGPVQWLEAYVRVGEIEEAVKVAMPSKMPEFVPYKLEHGEKLYPYDLLMLSPVRPVTEARNGNVLDVNRYFSVGVLDPQEYRRALSRKGSNLFTKYGRTDEDRDLQFPKTHPVRHLLNTEYFRQGVPDTAITKQFDRRSVQQSYVYDHRSLAEHLDAIDLPTTATNRLPENAQRVLKLIRTGRATGPIITEFRRILEAEGEISALDFLAAEAGGFHATPYGYCVQSFLTSGCPLHLECFNGCSNLVKSDEPHIDESLLQTESQLELALAHATKASPDTVGRQNQLEQIERKLVNVRRLRTANPGERAFPDGLDLSKAQAAGGTILDG